MLGKANRKVFIIVGGGVFGIYGISRRGTFNAGVTGKAKGPG